MRTLFFALIFVSGGDLSVLLALWFEGEVSITALRAGESVLPSTPSLLINCMPPRTTRKSYRPRASDRTMVGIFVATQLLVASETEGVVTDSNMTLLKKKERQELHNITWAGEAGKSKNLCSLQSRESFFLLTLTTPFIRTRKREKWRLVPKSPVI